MRTVKLTKEAISDILETMLQRSPANYGAYEARVTEILNQVRERGDEAVFEYTRQFDKFPADASNIQVTEEEIARAYERQILLLQR